MGCTRRLREFGYGCQSSAMRPPYYLTSRVIGSKGVSLVDPVPGICKMIGGIHLVCSIYRIVLRGDRSMTTSAGLCLVLSTLVDPSSCQSLFQQHPASWIMAPRRYDASGRPWRIEYWHQHMFTFILFAANVAAVVDPKARCLPGVRSQTHGRLVGARGEDPCVLAANVTGAQECGDENPWTLLPLDELQGQGYPAPGTPGSAKPTQCSCSRVAYNLFSACAACQRISGVYWVGYSVWDQSCSAEGIEGSDFDYSNDPAFLSWMSISDQDVFSVNAAIATLPPPTDDHAVHPLDGTKPPDEPRPLIPPANSGAADASATESASVGANTTNQPNLLPLILAPILSVSAVAALVVVWYYFYRRKRAKRVAPSAEFTKYQRAPIPLADVEGSGGAVGASVRGMRSIDNRPASYALQDNNNGEEVDGEAPPAFTPGLFKDPIFEKGVAMSLANQSGTWTGRRGHTSDTTTTGAGDVRTERQDSLGLAGGDSPASLSLLAAHGPGQLQLERQRLIPPAPEERD